MNNETPWPLVKLEQVVVDMQPGFAQAPDTQNATIPQLRTNNVTADGELSVAEMKYVEVGSTEIERFGVKRGDIIFNNTNSVEWVGKTAYFDLGTTFVLSNHMTRIRVDEDLVSAEFLAKYLHHLWRNGTARRWAKVWVNQAAIDQKDLSAFPLVLPPLIEQQHIVHILRQANELRRLRHEVDERARALLPALFEEMFGNPTTWEKTKPLAEFVNFVGGGTPDRRVAQYYTGSIPWATAKDIKARYLDDAEEHITTEAIQKSATTLVPADTILVVVKSKILTRALPLSIITQPFCFGQDIKGLVCHEGVVPQFIVAALLVQEQRVLNGARGVNTEGLTLEFLKKIPIPDVDPENHDLFARRVASIDAVDAEQIAATARYEDLFASLSAQAFTGGSHARVVVLRFARMHAL